MRAFGFVVVVVGIGLGACAAPPDTAEVALAECTAAQVADYEHVVIQSTAAMPTVRGSLVAPRGTEIEPGDDNAVCNCPDYDCVTDWVRDHMGCNLCAHVICDEGSIGGCASCPDVEGAPACALPGADPILTT